MAVMLSRSGKRRARRSCLLVLGFGVFFLTRVALAGTFTLTDGNSVVRIDPDTQAGAFDWSVDGVDMLGGDWLWYRIGAVGGERSIDSLGPAQVTQNTPNRLSVEYSAGGLDVSLSYVLSGGGQGFGVSSLAQSVRFRNSGNSAIDLSVFRLANFDVAGTPGNDIAEILNGIKLVQFEGSGPVGAESVQTGPLVRFEAGLAGVILASLNDGAPTTLNNFGGPAAGDVGGAFQWFRSLGPGQAITFSIDSGVFPEPTTALLLLAGLGAGMRILRRSRRLTA